MKTTTTIKSGKKRGVVENEESSEEEQVKSKRRRDNDNNKPKQQSNKKNKKPVVESSSSSSSSSSSEEEEEEEEEEEKSSSEEEILQKKQLSSKSINTTKSNTTNKSLPPPPPASIIKRSKSKQEIKSKSKPSPSKKSRSSLPNIRTTSLDSTFPTTSTSASALTSTPTSTSNLKSLKRRNSGASILSSTSSRRSPPPSSLGNHQRKAPSSAGSSFHNPSVSLHSPNGHYSSHSSSKPFRLTARGIKKDIIMNNFSLLLDFDNEVISPPTTTTANGKGKVRIKPPTRAKIDNLADATSFISFAFSRGKFSETWSSLKVVVKVSDLKGFEFKLSLILLTTGEEEEEEVGGEKLELITVLGNSTAGLTEEGRIKLQEEAELCAKFEVIKALILPSTTPSDFLSNINEDLVEYLQEDSVFADDPIDLEERAEEKDQEGKNLFFEYRRLHPRLMILKLESIIKGIGTMEFQEKCRDLVEIFEKATTVSINKEEGEETVIKRKGFGSWEGEIEKGFTKILGSIDGFCLKNTDYYSIALPTMSTLLEICIQTQGGSKTTSIIKFWFDKGSYHNELLDEKALETGIIRKKPLTIINTERKMKIIPFVPPPSPKKPLPSPTIEKVVENKEVIVSPVVKVEFKPTVDPRKRKSNSIVSLAPIVEADSFPFPSIVENSTIIEEEEAVEELMEEVIEDAVEEEKEIVELVDEANDTDFDEEDLLEQDISNHTQKSQSLHSSSQSNSSNNHLMSIDQQGPTPEATPEIETSSSNNNNNRQNILKGGENFIGKELIQPFSILCSPIEILEEKQLTRLEFNIKSEGTIRKLAAKIKDHIATLPINKLPYRAFAIFRSAEFSNEREENWSEVQLNVNGDFFNCFPLDTKMESFHKVEIPNGLLKSGINSIRFIKWRSQNIPKHLSISIEIYLAYTEKWFYSQLKSETEERAYSIYKNHASLDPPKSLCFLDPITEERIVNPVRGVKCEHLDTFDLDTFIARNRDTSQWICPHCQQITTPIDLRICDWTKSTLSTYDSDYLEVAAPVSGEEEEGDGNGEEEDRMAED